MASKSLKYDKKEEEPVLTIGEKKGKINISNMRINYIYIVSP